MNGYITSSNTTISWPSFWGGLPKSRRALMKELTTKDSIIHTLGTALFAVLERVDDAELDAQIAQDELEDMRHEHEDTIHTLESKTEEANILKTKLACMRNNIAELATGDFEKVYGRICDTLDPEGWQLYRTAEAYTGVDPSHAFPTEDNLGYFEGLNGVELIYWVEVAAFGECEYRQLDCGGGYELSTKRVIRKDTEKYKQYHKAICEQAVRKLLGLEAAENA